MAINRENDVDPYLRVIDELKIVGESQQEPDKKYPIIASGLFICINNYKFAGETQTLLEGVEFEKFNKCWSKILPMGYSDKGKYFLGENLKAKPNAGSKEDHKKYYDDFLNHIIQLIESRKDEISFIFCYVSSHGDENGTFLLSPPNAEDDPCIGGHKFETIQHYRTKQPYQHRQQCHRRSFDVLVASFQKLDALIGKPKIFIGDFCRYGADRSRIMGRESYFVQKPVMVQRPVMVQNEKNEWSEAKVHLAPDADTLILYATLADGDSIENSMLESLSEVVTDLKKKPDLESVQELVTEAKKQNLPGVKMEVEDCVNGWLIDVFLEVCHKVGFRKTTYCCDRNSNTKTPFGKQIPEIISSLTRRLSALDVFRDLKI